MFMSVCSLKHDLDQAGEKNAGCISLHGLKKLQVEMSSIHSCCCWVHCFEGYGDNIIVQVIALLTLLAGE